MGSVGEIQMTFRNGHQHIEFSSPGDPETHDILALEVHIQPLRFSNQHHMISQPQHGIEALLDALYFHTNRGLISRNASQRGYDER